MIDYDLNGEFFSSSVNVCRSVNFSREHYGIDEARFK